MQIPALLAIAALLASGPVSAQPLQVRPGTGAADQNTIVVTGRGVVRVPADRMRVEIHFYNTRTVAVAPPGVNAAATPNPGPTRVDLDTAGKTIAATLRAHGIPDARWVLPVLGSLSPQGSSPAIVGSIAKPTRERVEAIMRDALRAMPDSLAWMAASFQVQTSLSIDDCAPGEARAQAAAIADARARAQSIARAAGVRLGTIVAVSDLTGPFSNGCRTKPDDAGMFIGGGFNAYQYDPSLNVPIIVNATVTFAIK